MPATLEAPVQLLPGEGLSWSPLFKAFLSPQKPDRIQNGSDKEEMYVRQEEKLPD